MRHKMYMLHSSHRNQTSSAIDFDGKALKPLLQTGGVAMTEIEKSETEQYVMEEEKIFYRSVRKLDYCSAILTLICFIVSVCFWLFSDTQPKVAVQRTTWVVSQHKDLQDSMVLHAKQMNKYCPKSDIEQRLYRPWNQTSDQVITNKLRAEVVGSKVAVHVGTWNIWWFLIWIYAWAAGCQFARARAWNHTYHPYKGPDFARWFEYLMTSPLQIVVVCLAFGFSDLNSLLMTASAQAGLMILGYNIEITLKKTYRSTQPQKAGKTPKHFGWQVQQPILLGLAWLLHTLIWGWPRFFGIPASWWGIGGLYQLQEDINANCECYKEDDCNLNVPPWVVYIYWSQFFMFTVFGGVCTWQVVSAKRRAKPLDRISESRKWYKYTRIYAVCSITAKTLLEVFFLLFATQDMNFAQVDLTQFNLTWLFALASGGTNAPTHFDNCIANMSTNSLWLTANTVAHNMNVC